MPKSFITGNIKVMSDAAMDEVTFEFEAEDGIVHIHMTLEQADQLARVIDETLNNMEKSGLRTNVPLEGLLKENISIH